MKHLLSVPALVFALSFSPVASYAAGDAEKGKTLYAPCAACHGGQGEGNKAMNAPRLAGQSDWYLTRQIKNFKEGIRGAHPKDTYGAQMKAMAMTLPDDQAIEDVVAYILTLK